MMVVFFPLWIVEVGLAKNKTHNALVCVCVCVFPSNGTDGAPANLLCSCCVSTATMCFCDTLSS